MCIQHILLANSRLPEVRDNPEFPDLAVAQISIHTEIVDAVRRIAPARYLYSVGPSELCGCYFTYPVRAEHEARLSGPDGGPGLSGEDLRIAEWIWRQGHNSVDSFARYLERHADGAGLVLYVCWEGDEGKTPKERHTVRPSFFGGPGFARLPENSLFMILKEGVVQTVGAEEWVSLPISTATEIGRSATGGA